MSRAVMEQVLDVLQKGDVLCEFVACKILSAELAKPDRVIVAYQSESKPSDILSVEDYENIDPIWHWMYRPLYMPRKAHHEISKGNTHEE
jgi:hypothetical protein